MTDSMILCFYPNSQQIPHRWDMGLLTALAVHTSNVMLQTELTQLLPHCRSHYIQLPVLSMLLSTVILSLLDSGI